MFGFELKTYLLKAAHGKCSFFLPFKPTCVKTRFLKETELFALFL